MLMGRILILAHCIAVRRFPWPRLLTPGMGARSPGELFAEIVWALVERCAPAVERAADALDGQRAALLRHKARRRGAGATRKHLVGARGALAPARQRLVELRRFLRPQSEEVDRLLRWAAGRDAEARLGAAGDGTALFLPPALLRLREASALLHSMLERLDSATRAGEVLHDELMALHTELTDTSMFRLTWAAALLSALGIVTVGVDVATLLHAHGVIDLTALLQEKLRLGSAAAAEASAAAAAGAGDGGGAVKN